jgi:hypothetical protein
VCSWTTTGTAKLRRLGGRNEALAGREWNRHTPAAVGWPSPSPASTRRGGGAAATENGRLGGRERELTARRSGGGEGSKGDRERERAGDAVVTSAREAADGAAARSGVSISDAAGARLLEPAVRSRSAPR